MVSPGMRRSVRFGGLLVFAVLQASAGRAADWAGELPAAPVVRRTVKGADAPARLEAAFATLCDYVETRNGKSNAMPARARALFADYRCRARRAHPQSPEVARHFESAAFRRELLTTFISIDSFEIYAARSPTMRNVHPRTDRE
jgi:hypothetical protein